MHAQFRMTNQPKMHVFGQKQAITNSGGHLDLKQQDPRKYLAKQICF